MLMHVQARGLYMVQFADLPKPRTYSQLQAAKLRIVLSTSPTGGQAPLRVAPILACADHNGRFL
jgi:hypothetical protein